MGAGGVWGDHAKEKIGFRGGPSQKIREKEEQSREIC